MYIEGRTMKNSEESVQLKEVKQKLLDRLWLKTILKEEEFR